MRYQSVKSGDSSPVAKEKYRCEVIVRAAFPFVRKQSRLLYTEQGTNDPELRAKCRIINGPKLQETRESQSSIVTRWERAFNLTGAPENCAVVFNSDDSWCRCLHDRCFEAPHPNNSLQVSTVLPQNVFHEKKIVSVNLLVHSENQRPLLKP